jgi:hypothetical protein
VKSIEDTLKIKFVDGPRSNEVLKFTPDSTPVILGRMPDCTIILEDTSLSRYQCGFRHTIEGWKVFDGNCSRHSTNGTWLFVDEPYIITDGLIFKAGAVIFNAKIIS